MKQAAPMIRLLCSDLDGTLLGDPAAGRRFLRLWESLPVDDRPLLVYNSGRAVEDIRSIVGSRLLPQPDHIIGSVGTEIYDDRRGRWAEDFAARLDLGWDRAAVDRLMRGVPGATPQPAALCRRHKSSWCLPSASPAAIDDIRRRLLGAGLEATVIYSGRSCLDVVPSCAGKGPSLVWLCLRLGVPLEAVLVAGDSGNDRDMLLLPVVKRLMVGNAEPELIDAVAFLPAFVASRSMADGLIEGLGHFGLTDPEAEMAPGH